MADTSETRAVQDRAYQRALGLEGDEFDHHLDHGGTDTIGAGYTPVVQGSSKKWNRRHTVRDDFARIGVTLTQRQENALDTIADERNAGRNNSAAIQRARAELKSIELTPAQQRALFNVGFQRAEERARDYIGPSLDKLDPARKAEIVLAAYQSEEQVAKAGKEFARHIDAGDMDRLAGRLEQIGRDLGDQSRYRGAAAIMRDPDLKGRVMIRSGDVLGRIARDHGVSVDDLKKANPHIKSAHRIRAGDVLRLPDPSAPAITTTPRRKPEPPAAGATPRNQKTDAGDDFTPAQRALVAELTRSDEALDDILVKRPADLNEGEVRRVMARRNRLPDGPEQERLYGIVCPSLDETNNTSPQSFGTL